MLFVARETNLAHQLCAAFFQYVVAFNVLCGTIDFANALYSESSLRRVF